MKHYTYTADLYSFRMHGPSAMHGHHKSRKHSQPTLNKIIKQAQYYRDSNLNTIIDSFL